MRSKFPQYFSSLDGLLGLNALSILSSLFGLLILLKYNKKSFFAFILI